MNPHIMAQTWSCAIAMKRTLTILLLTVLAAIAHPTAAQAQRWLHYEPETVELDGRLVIQAKFGPPNYGEQPKTDQRVRVPVLVLADRVSMLPSKEEGHDAQPVYSVREIQLAFADSGTNYKNLIGKNVVVSGTLFHAHTGHHYTDVVLTVRSIELRPRDYGQQPFDVCRILTAEKHFGSNEILTEFRALIIDEPTRKSFKLRNTGLIVNATVEYREFAVTRKGIPRQIRIGLAVSDKEESAFDAANSVDAGANYKRAWGGLYVRNQVVVGDVEYSIKLYCFDGASSRNF